MQSYQRNSLFAIGKRGFACLLLLFLGACLSAAGSSPLETQNAQIGPYQLLLSFYSLPRAGQEMNMSIEPRNHTIHLAFSQVVLNPAKSTNANTIGVSIQQDKDISNVYDIQVTPPIRGVWLLHTAIEGPSGPVVGNIPIDVAGPPVIPTWLGWLIGLLPLPILISFIWFQITWRKTQRAQVRHELQQRPTF